MSQFVGGVAVDHILSSQAILPSGTLAIGIHDPSNQMKSVVHPVRNDSTHDPFVYMALFAVSHVRVHPDELSFNAIDAVLAAMSAARASVTTLIAPEIDPRVNI